MKITLSRSQWEGIGKKAGWIKTAEQVGPYVGNPDDWAVAYLVNKGIPTLYFVHKTEDRQDRPIKFESEERAKKYYDKLAEGRFVNNWEKVKSPEAFEECKRLSRFHLSKRQGKPYRDDPVPLSLS